MSRMDKLKKAVDVAKKGKEKVDGARRTYRKVKRGVDDAKDFANDAMEDDLTSAAANLAKKKGKEGLRKKGRKVAKQAAKKVANKVMKEGVKAAGKAAGKSIIGFLITPPWGWVVSAILLVLLMVVASANEGGKLVDTHEEKILMMNEMANNCKVEADTVQVNVKPGKFPKEVKDLIVKLGAKERVLPSVTLAQWAIETGWGTSRPWKDDNNPGGITWFEGSQYPKGGVRGVGGSEGGYYIHFPDMKTGFQYGYYDKTIKANFKSIIGETDAKTVTDLLQKGGYAKASDYAQTLMGVIKANNLTEVDKEVIKHWSGSLPGGGSDTAGSSSTDNNASNAADTHQKVEGVPENAMKLWEALKKYGLTDAGAAGVMAAAEHESDFNPKSTNSGGYTGIFQWSAGAYKSDHTIEGDIKFALETLDGKGYNAFHEILTPILKSTNDPIEAADAWLVLFERAVGGPYHPKAWDKLKGHISETGYQYNPAEKSEKWMKKLAGVAGVDTTVNECGEEENDEVNIGGGKIDVLEKVLGQRVENGQCYGLTSYYVEKMGFQSLMGTGHAYASKIGDDYDWASKGWTVIHNPKYSDYKAGDVINWNKGGFATSKFGHTGVIRSVDGGGKFTTYEQNASKGEIVAVYKRTMSDFTSVASLVRKK